MITTALLEHGCNPRAVALSDALVWSANRQRLISGGEEGG